MSAFDGYDFDSLLDDVLAGVNAGGVSVAEAVEDVIVPELIIPERGGQTPVVPFFDPVGEEAQVHRKNTPLENSILKATGDVDRDRVVKYLGWNVERTPLILPDGTPVKTHVAQVRSDNRTIVGVVTSGFSTIQNDELIQLADAVSNGTGLKFANAGMVDGGSRVFFQCRGESFDIGDGDEIAPYMLFCNGHDGSLSCRMIPMTQRTFCQNQLGNIVKRQASYAVIRHTGDVKSKLAEAGRLGKLYFATVKANRESMLELRNTAVKTADLQKFFHGVYEKQFGIVQAEAKTEAQEREIEKMKEGFGQFVKRFEQEKSLAGATAWNMANAYTWWLQHSKGVGKNPQATAQRRLESSLFGASAKRSVEAFRVALEMAG
jgi:phage/plasmid-like protein (TIGR03299 family)